MYICVYMYIHTHKCVYTHTYNMPAENIAIQF